VEISIFWFYFKQLKISSIILCTTFIFASQGFSALANFTLSNWSDESLVSESSGLG
jgi:hypothetical protein